MSFLDNLKNKVSKTSSQSTLFLDSPLSSSLRRVIPLGKWSQHLFSYPTYHKPIQKGSLTVIDGIFGNYNFIFHFNPEEIEQTISSNYTEYVIPGLPKPILQYANGNLEKLSFSLLFDVSENFIAQGWESRLLATPHTAVATEIIMLGNKMNDIYNSIYGNEDEVSLETTISCISEIVNPSQGYPKKVIFTYGKFNFESVVQSAVIRRIRFDSKGNCVRAIINFSLTEYSDISDITSENF